MGTNGRYVLVTNMYCSFPGGCDPEHHLEDLSSVGVSGMVTAEVAPLCGTHV